MHKIEFTCPEYRLLIFGKVYIIKMAQFYQNYDKKVHDYDWSDDEL